MRKIKWGVFLVVAFAAALALPGNVAHVQPLHDHFRSYLVSGHLLPTPLGVSLQDQFGTVQGTVEYIRMFSPPVEKRLPTGETSPIIHPENHLTWYDFVGTSEERTLLVTNQFGTDQEWVVKDPVYLLLPAWKPYVNEQPTYLDPPSGLDHYLCYDVISGPPVGLDGVILTDQFHQEQVTVGDPVVFCNPVEKTVLPIGPTYDIIDPDNHLACYDAPGLRPPWTWDVSANDQFGDSMFLIGEYRYLCVPSEKKIKPSGCFASIAEGVE